MWLPEMRTTRSYTNSSSSDALSRSLQEIFSPVRLPADLTLRTLGCDGVSNAWYQQSVVSVCYEYIREIYEFAPRETTASGITPSDAVLGQFFYVFAHEMGHAVYDVLKIPVLGTEEDAADHFAAYIMLQFGRDQARRLIVGAAYAYDRYLKNPTVVVPLVAFSGSHSPPAQRFFNLVCLAYGSDSTTVFADLVELGYLPSSRAPRCRREFNRVVVCVPPTRPAPSRPRAGEEGSGCHMAARRHDAGGSGNEELIGRGTPVERPCVGKGSG